jgi:four helix bundle protein
MLDLNLKKRTFEFAVAVGKLVKVLLYNMVNRAYINQIIRSSSSVGANYRAAQRAKSGNDFLNKLKIVEEESDESVYFLELLLVFNPEHSNNIILLINEGTEILRIVVASIVTVRERLNNNKK